MNAYPSILLSAGQRFQEFDAHVFDKLDGRQIRVEWNPKRGWNKFGTKERLFDESDNEFGPAKAMFLDYWSDRLTGIAKEHRWQRATAYLEYWGPQSLGGILIPGDEMRMTLFDVAVDKRGLLPPREFVKTFEHLPTARYLGMHRWTRGFLDRVWRGEVEGITQEGVIGKAGAGAERIMAKAKTQAWNAAIKARYPNEAERLINS